MIIERICSIYKKVGLLYDNITQEEESAEYAAYRFNLGNKAIIFRAARITPTKIGQFVTCWKRIGSGPIMPFDIADPFDYLIIDVQTETQHGQFILPKNALHKQGYVSAHGTGGKRAIRVYAPWDMVESKQALKTKAWQAAYFIEIKQDNLDAQRMLELLDLKEK